MASSASSASGTAPRPAARVDLLQQRHRRLRPHAPMPEQATLEAQRRLLAAVADGERRGEVGDDVIVVAGVERDAVRRTRRRHAEGDIKRLVAVEGRDLDGDDVVEAGKARPEGARQRNAADRRLQVEADGRHLARHGRAMLDELVLARPAHGAEAQQHRVVAERTRDARLLHGLRRPADHAGDHHQRPLRPRCCRLGGKLQHRAVEADVADLELRRMHADRQPAGAGVDVVARQRPLRGGIELALLVERQGMGGDHRAPAQDGQHVGGNVGPGRAAHGLLLLTLAPGPQGRRCGRRPPRPGRARAACA